MRSSLAVASFVALVAAAPPARADAPAKELSIDGQRSTVTYHLVHKLHRFDGTSHKVDGRARLLPGGAAQVMVRIPVESFDSKNVNRDAHMKETVEVARFPDVELKALGEGVAVPASFPATVERRMKAQVTFHGVQQLLDVPVKITFESADRVRAESSFTVSVDSFKIERPSLLFVKIDDDMTIDANLVFHK
jgi:polyisoprenoid-binding protein YceI